MGHTWRPKDNFCKLVLSFYLGFQGPNSGHQACASTQSIILPDTLVFHTFFPSVYQHYYDAFFSCMYIMYFDHIHSPYLFFFFYWCFACTHSCRSQFGSWSYSCELLTSGYSTAENVSSLFQQPFIYSQIIMEEYGIVHLSPFHDWMLARSILCR